MKKGIVVAAAICLLMLPGLSYAVGLEAAIGVWRQSIDGETSYKGSSRADIINIQDDFNADDYTRVMGRVKIDMPAVLPNIYIMAAHMEFEGTGEKDVDFSFGGVDINAGRPFQGRLNMSHVDLCLYYGIPFLNLATLNNLNIDLGINLKIADLEGEIIDKDTGAKDSDGYTLPIPMVYGAVQFTPTKKLSLEAEGRAVSISGNHLYNIIGRVSYKIFGPAFLAAGYRYDSINLDEKQHKLDCTVDGYFVETGFSF